MDIQDILPYVGTNKTEKTLEIVYGIHKQSLDNKSLKNAPKVNLTFSSGLSTQGYVIGLDKHANLLTLVNFLDSDQTYYIEYIELHGIQSVGIGFSEKNIEKFCATKAPEGLGAPPTVLDLKRKQKAVEEKLQNTFHNTLKVHIDWQEINPENNRTLWAIDGILKQIVLFKRSIEDDIDLIETFNHSVKQITIINSNTSKMNIHEGVFTIAFMFSNGLIDVENSEAIKGFLYKVL